MTTSPYNRRLANEALAECETIFRELASRYPELRATESYLEYLRHATDDLRDLQGVPSGGQEAVAKALEAQERMSEDVEEYRESLQEYVGVLERHFALSRDYVRRLLTLPSLDRSPIRHEDVVALAEEGWYLDPKLPVNACGVLAAVLAKGDAAAVSEWLVKHFRQRADEIEVEVAETFPRRTHILQEAFEAHRQKNYSLSIPAFLAQADGMCSDAFALHLFTGRPGRRVAELRKTNKNIMLDPLLRLLGARLAAGINRHEILHGRDLRYGTEANSLKAISLLAYLSFVRSSVTNAEEGGTDGHTDTPITTP